MPAVDASRTTSTTQTCRSTPCVGGRLKIIQHQMGHKHASTTGIYQFVSSDFRNATLTAALNRTVERALDRTSGETS